MGWRNAYSIDVLRGEVWALSPGQVIGTIGDESHQGTWSDHNPNAAGVVCAADIMPGNGLDLTWVANRIVATDPPALKYVIWGDRIWFPGLGWQPYYGAFHSHVHVSVGWGPDGRSTGPYDDRSPWGLLTLQEETMIYARTASNATVWVSDGLQRRPVSRMASIIGGEAAVHMLADDAALTDLCGPPYKPPPAAGPTLAQIRTVVAEELAKLPPGGGATPAQIAAAVALELAARLEAR